MTLILAIIGHLVGDYLLQNDWMALNKKKPLEYCGNFLCDICTLKRIWFGWFNLPCMVHCSIWTFCVCAIAGWWNWLPCAVLFVAHYGQDRTNIVLVWMTKINRQEKFSQPPCAPWSIIVVDNVWHIVTIWAVWKFLLHSI